MTMIHLEDALILRHATADDTDALTRFNGWVHAWPNDPNPRIAARTREQMDGTHPQTQPNDFLVVIDTSTGAIVSSLCVMRQQWAYAGIPIAVEQIEFVGTAPAYRRRGLVRRMIELAHQEGIARGAQIQVINGIPNYYRQFGYALALAMGGGRSGPRGAIAALPTGMEEPCRVRAAVPADLPFITDLESMASQRYLFTHVRDEALWRYELDGRGELNIFRRLWRIIETYDGTSIGSLAYAPRFSGTTRWLSHYELAPGISWLAATPVVLRYLAASDLEGPPCDQIGGWLGCEHPLYQALPRSLPIVHSPDAWYVRVSDLPAFLRQIAPVLEQRLSSSIASGYSGVLRLNFYRSGIVLRFATGRLVSVEAWDTPNNPEASASFPDRTFIQLLCGYRTLGELMYAFDDCTIASEAAEVLLSILFPHAASLYWITG